MIKSMIAGNIAVHKRRSPNVQGFWRLRIQRLCKLSCFLQHQLFRDDSVKLTRLRDVTLCASNGRLVKCRSKVR